MAPEARVMSNYYINIGFTVTDVLNLNSINHCKQKSSNLNDLSYNNILYSIKLLEFSQFGRLILLLTKTLHYYNKS